MNLPPKISALVLAAGKGTRMKSENPKVATLLKGKSLILYVVDTLLSVGIHEIIVVVGFKKEVVIEILKEYPQVRFVEQKEQLGTGHAVLTAESVLGGFEGDILVCCGDVPLISKKSFLKMIQEHSLHKNSVTVLSAKVSHPKGYGRIIRSSLGRLEQIVEEKDATEEERLVTEINTGTYIFSSPSVFAYLKTINSNNAQNEYYLPDLVKIYNSKNNRTDAILLENALEGTGVNSPDDLTYLEELLTEGKLSS
jgi:UDP-N-acetylglucosamine pyrophosphorylase